MWAFGVVAWEVVSYGKKPYREVADSGLAAHLKRGKRLARPARSGDELVEIWQDTWADEADDRPSFPVLLRLVSQT